MNAQVLFHGKVFEASTKKQIPFVSIGIPGKNVGTVSDANGNFKVLIPNNNLQDSLKFFAFGFKPLSFNISDLEKRDSVIIFMKETAVDLDEIVVKPENLTYKKLGVKHYSTSNCTGFVDATGNWKGSEAAVLFHNSKNIFLEYFAFYVIQNKYTDSLLFRLNFYKTTNKNWVGASFTKKSIVFKICRQQGEIKIPLSEYNIQTKEDFFVSMECLMEELDIRKFCYSGSLKTPSYYKVKSFSKWHSTRGTNQGGGGADFRVLVSFSD